MLKILISISCVIVLLSACSKEVIEPQVKEEVTEQIIQDSTEVETLNIKDWDKPIFSEIYKDGKLYNTRNTQYNEDGNITHQIIETYIDKCNLVFMIQEFNYTYNEDGSRTSEYIYSSYEGADYQNCVQGLLGEPTIFITTDFY